MKDSVSRRHKTLVVSVAFVILHLCIFRPRTGRYLRIFSSIKKLLLYKKMAGSLVPPMLHPSSLYKEEARRDATRIRTYNTILGHIHNKIRATARVPGSTKAVWYVIPELVPGAPRFDMGDAVIYIAWNLRNEGYAVEFVYPNGLYVSWQSHDERYRSVESPWSKVLQHARTAIATAAEEITPTVISTAKSAPSLSTPPEIVKRKSVLKKTVEFTPTVTTPMTTNPTVLGAMYSSAPPTTPSIRLPGQLTEKHVSFV